MCINYALEQNQSNAIRSCALKPREITDVPLAPSRFFLLGEIPGGNNKLKHLITGSTENKMHSFHLSLGSHYLL